MSTPPPKLDARYFITTTAAAVTAMNPEEAGAATMTPEQAFDKGKTLGFHLANAAMSSRYLLSFEEHIKMRQKEIEELAKLKEDMEKQSPDVGLVFLHKLLDSNTLDLEFIDAQYARYKKDFANTSVVLAELDEKKEERTKDGN